MAAAQASIPWTDNLSVLQQAIYKILAPILTPQYAQLLFTLEAMQEYWSPAFTHRSALPRPYNNEDFEFDGDLVLARQFNKYLTKRFGTRLSPSQGTYFQNTYMSKSFQAELSRRLGLDKLVRYDPTVPGVTTDIAEDVFEAFAGALAAAADEKITDGLGDIFVFNFIREIFQSVTLNLDEVARDSTSSLKELYDKLGWGEVSYKVETSDRPEFYEKVTIQDPNGTVLGIGYGDQTTARGKAASEALETLRLKNITRESADQKRLEIKRKASTLFDLEYKRVQKAVEKLNQQATKQGKVQIANFKLSQAPNTKSGNQIVYTYTVDLAYPSGDGKLHWKPAVHASDLNQNMAQVNALKSFADQVLA